MDFFFGRLRRIPELDIPLYQAAPPRVYGGLLLQYVDGVRSGGLPWWIAAVLAAGVLFIAGDQGRYRYRLGLAGQMLCGISLILVGRHLARASHVM